MKRILEQSIDCFLKQEFYKAYELIYSVYKKYPQEETVIQLLGIYSSVLKNADLSNHYFSLLETKTLDTEILSGPNMLRLLSVSNEVTIEDKWKNYKRNRNQNEYNRMAVTAPLCEGNVLEIGCANGDLSSVIAMFCDHLTGIDINPVAIELARYNVFKKGLQNCKFDLRSGVDLKFNDNEFDTVLLAEVLEHVDNPKPFILEAYRVCKPNGKLIISVPKGYKIPDEDHQLIFNKKILNELVGEVLGQEVVWIDNVPDSWLMGYVIKNEVEHLTSKMIDEVTLPVFNHVEMNDTSKVSIIVPTYNRADLLKKSLESIINQTYKNIEILVVDDGSTDDTETVVKSFDQQVAISYLKQENSGKSVALNRVINDVTGDYVIIFDDDDIMLPRKIEIQMRLFKQMPLVDLIHTSAICFDDVDNQIVSSHYHKAYTDSSNVLHAKLGGNRFFTPTVAMKASCIKEIGEYDSRLIRAQDYDYWIRTAHKFTTYGVDVPTVQYRLHQRTRGTKEQVITSNEIHQKTMKYHKLALAKMAQYKIEDIFPQIELNQDNITVRIEAYLERAMYFSIYDLTEECLNDIMIACSLLNTSELPCFTTNGLMIISKLEDELKNWENQQPYIQVLKIIRLIRRVNQN